MTGLKIAVDPRYDVSDAFYVTPHTEVSALLLASALAPRERVLVNGGAALGVEF